MALPEKRRITAYERVLGDVAKPGVDEDGDDEEDVRVHVVHTTGQVISEGLLSLVNTSAFTTIVSLAVLFNIIAMILLTFPEYSARMSYFFLVLDSLFFGIYMAEAILKILALGVGGYFRSGWNRLDFLILLTSALDFIVNFLGSYMPAGSASALRVLRIFRTLRALRALRMLRMVTLLENLQIVVNTVFQSIGSMTIIFALMILFLYMFAVMGRQLYAQGSPYYFGDLFKATTTMFQLLTFDDWFYIYDDVNKVQNNWHFIIFCIIYSLAEYFVFLNLFMAVLVDNFQLKSAVIADSTHDEMAVLDLEEDKNVVSSSNQQLTQWPQGRPTLHYNPYLEDLGHLPLEERILYVQFYNTICALDYHAYVQRHNFLVMQKLLDKCQDPRLLMNAHAEHE